MTNDLALLVHWSVCQKLNCRFSLVQFSYVALYSPSECLYKCLFAKMAAAQTLTTDKETTNSALQHKRIQNALSIH